MTPRCGLAVDRLAQTRQGSGAAQVLGAHAARRKPAGRLPQHPWCLHPRSAPHGRAAASAHVLYMCPDGQHDGNSGSGQRPNSAGGGSGTYSRRSAPAGADRSEASARSAGQSSLGLGGRTPGRSLGTRTRSACGRKPQAGRHLPPQAAAGRRLVRPAAAGRHDAAGLTAGIRRPPLAARADRDHHAGRDHRRRLAIARGDGSGGSGHDPRPSPRSASPSPPPRPCSSSACSPRTCHPSGAGPSWSGCGRKSTSETGRAFAREGNLADADLPASISAAPASWGDIAALRSGVSPASPPSRRRSPSACCSPRTRSRHRPRPPRRRPAWPPASPSRPARR